MDTCYDEMRGTVKCGVVIKITSLQTKETMTIRGSYDNGKVRYSVPYTMCGETTRRALVCPRCGEEICNTLSNTKDALWDLDSVINWEPRDPDLGYLECPNCSIRMEVRDNG